MRGLVLTGPSQDIENPSEEHLRRIIFESDEAFWNAGCGDGAGFFFQFQPARGHVLAPYDGTGCDDLVSHSVGGEPFWVPRACDVSREMAWHIVRNDAEHREPSPLGDVGTVRATEVRAPPRCRMSVSKARER